MKLPHSRKQYGHNLGVLSRPFIHILICYSHKSGGWLLHSAQVSRCDSEPAHTALWPWNWTVRWISASIHFIVYTFIAFLTVTRQDVLCEKGPKWPQTVEFTAPAFNKEATVVEIESVWISNNVIVFPQMALIRWWKW